MVAAINVDDVLRTIAATGAGVAAIFTYLNRRGQRVQTNGNLAAERKRAKRIAKNKPNSGDAVWMIQRQLETQQADTRAHYEPLLERMDGQHKLMAQVADQHDEILKEVRRIVKRVEGVQEVQEEREASK